MINYLDLFKKSKKLAIELELTQLELYQRFMLCSGRRRQTGWKHCICKDDERWQGM